MVNAYHVFTEINFDRPLGCSKHTYKEPSLFAIYALRKNIYPSMNLHTHSQVAATENTDEDTTDNTEVQSAVSDMDTDPGK